MFNISISVCKDQNAWHVWDAWSQFQIINNVTFGFSEHSDILVCDMQQVYMSNIDDLNQYFSNFTTVILFDLLDVPDGYPDDDKVYPRYPSKLQALAHKKIIVITQDYYFLEQCPKNITVLFHNFLLNRSKLYLMYGLDACKSQQPGFQFWYHNTDKNYYKPDVPDEIMFTPVHPKHKPTERKYAYLFAANRISDARTAIYNQLKKIKKISGITLYKNERLEEEKDVVIPYYKPLPPKIYLDCYVNIYVETNEKQNNLFNSAHLTEKTIEPILRYQLILPFATTNFYRYLKMIDIKICNDLILHDWRQIENDQQRLDMFLLNLQSIEKNFTLADIRDIYYSNLETIRNNSFVLYNTPFCQSIRSLPDLLN